MANPLGRCLIAPRIHGRDRGTGLAQASLHRWDGRRALCGRLRSVPLSPINSVARVFDWIWGTAALGRITVARAARLSGLSDDRSDANVSVAATTRSGHRRTAARGQWPSIARSRWDGTASAGAHPPHSTSRRDRPPVRGGPARAPRALGGAARFKRRTRRPQRGPTRSSRSREDVHCRAHEPLQPPLRTLLHGTPCRDRGLAARDARTPGCGRPRQRPSARLLHRRRADTPPTFRRDRGDGQRRGLHVQPGDEWLDVSESRLDAPRPRGVQRRDVQPGRRDGDHPR